MKLLAEIRARLGALLHGRRAERETEEEVRFHLDMETAKHVRAGMSPDQARRRALIAFGGVARAQEEVHDARGLRWLEDLASDLRYAGRQLRRSPGFAAVAIATLALGIGANAAIFSVVNGVLLRSVPFADPERLVVVWETDRRSGTTREPASWPDYLDFRRLAHTLAASAALTGMEASLTPDRGAGEPERLSGVATTPGFFQLVGVRPLAGRAFTEEEDQPGAPNVVLLGEELWRGRYGSDPGIVGRSIRVNDAPHLVIGILPAGTDFGLDQIHAQAAYHGPYTGAGEVEVWVPLRASAASFPRETHPFFVLGRLAPGAGLGAAREELTRIAADLERSYRSNDQRGVNLEPLGRVVFGPIRPVLLLLLAAVALVLLVACVNVANLLLARGAARAREMAVRGALGAGSGRLGRQFVAESVLLALLGALAGVGLALGGLRALLALAPGDIPRIGQVGIDARVLGATLVVSLVVGVVFGLVPTAQAFRLDVMGQIKGGGRGGQGGRGGPGGRGFREGLVVTELALSVMLVVCAALLIRSFWSVLRVDPGFRAEGVLKAEYQLPETRYPRDYSKWPNWTEIHRFNQSVLERARRIPGVASAAIAGQHPLDAGFTSSFLVVGREAEARSWPEISMRFVTPGYFVTLGVSLRQGRTLSDADDARAPQVAVINQAAARRFFPDGDPIGAEIRFWGITRRIVGVVGDERFHGLTEAAAPAVYCAIPQSPSSSGALLVRAVGDPAELASAVRRAIRSADPELAVYGVEPLSKTLLDSVGQRRFAMLVLGVFAGVTLALALVGVHGVLSYATSQRAREIGIRVALGATRQEVAAQVVKGGLLLAAAGIALGVLGALAGSRLLTSLLFGVTRADPLTYTLVPATVLVAAALATWLPARRAARVDPIDALRAE